MLFVCLFVEGLFLFLILPSGLLEGYDLPRCFFNSNLGIATYFPPFGRAALEEELYIIYGDAVSSMKDLFPAVFPVLTF